MTTAVQTLLPIANFTDCKQAIALAEKFGDRDLEKLSDIDQAALVVILSKFVYLNLIQHLASIWDAAEQAISENEDQTSENMGTALDLLEGIDPDDAIALIQFLVQ